MRWKGWSAACSKTWRRRRIDIPGSLLGLPCSTSSSTRHLLVVVASALSGRSLLKVEDERKRSGGGKILTKVACISCWQITKRPDRVRGKAMLVQEGETKCTRVLSKFVGEMPFNAEAMNVDENSDKHGLKEEIESD